MNDQNLKPLNGRPAGERSEIARAGGIASGIARREKMSMRERIRLAMDQQTDDGGQTFGDVAAVRLVEQAANGDIRAIRLIGDYLGEFKQRIELEEQTPPIMTKAEATAIYNAGIDEQARQLATSLETGTPLKVTALFEQAADILGIDSARHIADVMQKSDEYD